MCIAPLQAEKSNVVCVNTWTVRLIAGIIVLTLSSKAPATDPPTPGIYDESRSGFASHILLLPAFCAALAGTGGKKQEE
jgi:hypothetical protein